MGLDAEAARAWIDAQDLQPEPGAEPAPDLTQPFVVWPENWPVLGLFLRLQTQWVYRPDGRREGLSYPAVQSAMWGMGVKKRDRTRLWDQLVQMEHAAVEACNEL